MDNLLKSGVELFNSGEFFECHEFLEDAWRVECAPRRLFLQAIIHIAVGCYHVRRNNLMGARGQLDKGLRKLRPYLPAYEAVDTARLYREAFAVRGLIEAGAPLAEYPQIHVLWSSVGT
jgi:predicted metal-dependent hydrolase